MISQTNDKIETRHTASDGERTCAAKRARITSRNFKSLQLLLRIYAQNEIICEQERENTGAQNLYEKKNESEREQLGEYYS